MYKEDDFNVICTIPSDEERIRKAGCLFVYLCGGKLFRSPYKIGLVNKKFFGIEIDEVIYPVRSSFPIVGQDEVEKTIDDFKAEFGQNELYLPTEKEIINFLALFNCGFGYNLWTENKKENDYSFHPAYIRSTATLLSRSVKVNKPEQDAMAYVYPVIRPKEEETFRCWDWPWPDEFFDTLKRNFLAEEGMNFSNPGDDKDVLDAQKMSYLLQTQWMNFQLKK